MRARRSLTVLILASAASAVMPWVHAEEPSNRVVEAPRQVTGDGDPMRLHDIPALAVHPHDPDTVVMAVGDARNGGCGLRVSRDAGLSWRVTAANLLPDPTGYCIQRALGPVMAPAFGSDGTLYVAMPFSKPTSDFANGPIDLVVASTSDLGVTHETVTVAKSEVVTVNPANYGGLGDEEQGNTWHKFPSLVVDPKNPERLYLGWRWYVYGLNLQSLSGDVPFRPYFATSDDGGKTWSKPIDLAAESKGTPVFGASAPMLVVAPNGDVYGFSKELLKPAAPGTTNPPARVLMFKSTDAGRTWTNGDVVTDPGPNLQASPTAAVDQRNGNLYVAYGAGPAHTPATEPPPAPQKVFVTASTDAGRTWSKPVKVDDPSAPADRGDEFYPNIAVAPNGRLDLAWHDFRNEPFGPRQVGNFYRGERYWDVYYSSSNDGGATWSKNVRVTQPSIDGKEGGTFNNIDTRGPIGLQSTEDAAYLAWSDTRATQGVNDAEDAYFTRIRYAVQPELGSSPGRPGWFSAALGSAVTLAVGGVLLLLVGRGTRPSRPSEQSSTTVPAKG